MHFTLALSILALPFAGYAQIYGGPLPPSTPTTAAAVVAPAAPSAPPSTSNQINVDVYPNAAFVFNPSNFTASNGTLVTFFFPTSTLTHSVTQSSFEDPCTYLVANGSTPGGFDSGLTSGAQFTINITDDTQPIWFHCKQITHCGLGMVGSINAPTTGNNTFAAFQAAAIAIGSSEVTETDNGFVSGGVDAVATVSPANTATASAGSSGSSSGASRVASASIGLAGIAVALFLLA